MIRKIIEGLLSPLTRLGEKYLETQRDREKIDAGVTQVAIDADAAVRKIKLSSIFLAFPLWVTEMSAAAYTASIFIDSTYASDWINPLELPDWFKEHYAAVLASVLGLAVFERIVGRKRK